LENDVSANVAQQIGAAHRVYFTSIRDPIGLDELERAIRDNLEPAKRDRWVRSIKAYTEEFLSEKKSICERRVTLAAGASLVSGAAGALVPVPGANFAVDVPLLMSLFKFIRDTYGLTNFESLTERAAPLVGPAADAVVRYATRDGVLSLLARFASSEVAQNLAKFIPFVGAAIAALFGFGITYNCTFREKLTQATSLSSR
jgi:uncharacterized protein (DUF697 family)